MAIECIVHLLLMVVASYEGEKAAYVHNYQLCLTLTNQFCNIPTALLRVGRARQH